MTKKPYENPWTYKGAVVEELTKDVQAFVYIIEDIDTGRKYVGKKFCWMPKKIAGKTRRKFVESNWKRYYSSHEWIKGEAKKNPNRFRREILHLCETRGKANFLEIEEQFKRGVLYTDDYLNDQILGKYFKSNVRHY
jgi:hypothetical protein